MKKLFSLLALMFLVVTMNAQTQKKVYDETIIPSEQISAAVAKASAANKFVIAQ